MVLATTIAIFKFTSDIWIKENFDAIIFQAILFAFFNQIRKEVLCQIFGSN